MLPQGELPLTLIAWPHTNFRPALAVLPPDALIGVWPGPETRGDLEKDTYRLYVRWLAEPLSESVALPKLSTPLARFENSLLLVDIQTERTSQTLRVTLEWSSEHKQSQPVQAFIHVVGKDGAILAQFDETPGTIYYPPLSWQPGSVIIHSVTLTVIWPDETEVWLLVGLYDPVSGNRMSILETSAKSQNDALYLPLSDKPER